MAVFTAGPNGFNMATGFLNTAPNNYTLGVGSITSVFPNGDTELLTGTIMVSNGLYVAGDAMTIQHMTGQTVDYTISNTDLSYNVTYRYSYGTAPGGGGYGYGYGAVAAPTTSTPTTPQQLASYVFQGNDAYIGSQTGNDTFVTAGGNNTVAGGAGFETVQFQGSRSAYTIASNHDGTITVTDSVPTRNGVDHMGNITFLQFADKGTVVTSSGTTPTASVALLYSAAFNRAPDQAGLAYWQGVYAPNPTHDMLVGVATGFVNSAEFRAAYGTQTDPQYVTQLYQNVLGRAPDAAGLSFWTNDLAHGDSRAAVLVGFSGSAENIAKASADWLFVM